MSVFRHTAVSQVRPMPRDTRKIESYIHHATCKAVSR